LVVEPASFEAASAAIGLEIAGRDVFLTLCRTAALY
jgi:hypothetical protein